MDEKLYIIKASKQSSRSFLFWDLPTSQPLDVKRQTCIVHELPDPYNLKRGATKKMNVQVKMKKLTNENEKNIW